jgi:perosamine synthetase
MCSILVNEPALRDPLRDALATKGIETRPLFYPIHTMPMYAHRFQRHLVAENLGWRGINLPSYPELTTEDIDYICMTIQNEVS